LTHLSLFSLPNPPPTAIYTLSLHDALPISQEIAIRSAAMVAFQQPQAIGHAHVLRNGAARSQALALAEVLQRRHEEWPIGSRGVDRKSTRLNSSHVSISYAVFCLKKKNDDL